MTVRNLMDNPCTEFEFLHGIWVRRTQGSTDNPLVFSLIIRTRMISETRESSQLIVGPLELHEVDISTKLFSVIQNFNSQPYSSPDLLGFDEIVQRADELLHRLREPVFNGRATQRKRPAFNHRDLINYKRTKVQAFYELGFCASISEVAKLAKVSHKMAKDVIFGLKLKGGLIRYDYNGLHPQLDVEKLRKTIMSPFNLYLSVGDIKRLHPQFSTNFITR